MWGTLGRREQEGGRTIGYKTQYEEDRVTPSWQSRHPAWVLLISTIQIIMLSAVVYEFTLPSLMYSQQSATRKSLENTAYERRGLDCTSRTEICTFGGELPWSHDNSIFAGIVSIDNVFTWLYHVVAVYHQEAYVGNFNQVYMTTLTLERCPLINENDPHYSGLVRNYLDLSDCGSHEDNTYERDFFRTETADAKLQDILIDLRDNSGWFASTTSMVKCTIKTFNGMTRSWSVVTYTFHQSASGRIEKLVTSEVLPMSLTNNPNIATQLGLTYVVLLLILADVVREILLIHRMWRRLRNFQPTARTQLEQVPVTYSRSPVGHYIRHRWLSASARIARLILFFFLCYRMWRYATLGISDVLMASQNRLDTIPESSTPFQSSAVFTAAGAICIFLGFAMVIVTVGRLHPDFQVVFGTIADFFLVFYSCLLLFVLLWIGWSFMNCLVAGSSFLELAHFGSSMATTYHIMFGGTTLGLLSPTERTTSELLMYVFMMLVIFGIIFPVAGAAITYSYAFRESLRLVDMNSVPTGHWIQRQFIQGCQRRCFFFTPDPTLQMLHEEEIPIQGEQRQGAGVSTVADITATWTKRSFLVYLLFLVLFSTGVVFLLGGSMTLKAFRVMQSTLLDTAFLDVPELIPVPYEGNAPNIPLREDTPIDPDVLRPINITDIIHYQSLAFFIRDIIILRLMNPDYYRERHTVPLCNPLTIFFPVSSHQENTDPWMQTLWPSTTTETMIDSSRLFTYVDQLGLSDEANYTHVTDLGTHFVLRLYYGDPLTAAEQLMDQSALNEQVLRWTTREMRIPFAEYNGDAGVFLLHQFTVQGHITGKLSVSLDTLAMRESNDPSAYVTEQPVVSYFNNAAFDLFLVSFLCCLLYFVVILWMTFQHKVKLSKIGTVFDLLLLATNVGFLVGMSDVLLPTFNPLWGMREEVDVNAPTPTIGSIPGPAILHPISNETAFSHSLYQPSTRHAFRILRQMTALAKQGKIVYYGASFAALVGTLRLAVFFFTIPNTLISKSLTLLFLARWKLFMIAIIILVGGIGHALIGLLCWGHRSFEYSTLGKSWLSGWLLATPAWNLKLSNDALTNVGPLGVLCRLLLALCFAFVLLYLIVAAILYEIKRLKQKTQHEMQVGLYRTCNLKAREKHTIRANHKVLVEWNAVAKALVLRTRRNDNDGEFARQIHGFFEHFQNSKTFQQAPANMIEYLKRGILAHHLTRIQQYLSDLILIKCKTSLVRQDIADATAVTEAVSQTTKGKSEYIKTLERRLQTLKDKLAVLEDTIQFEKADLRPDIVAAYTHSREAANGAAVHRTPEALDIERAALRRQRSEKRRRRRRRQQEVVGETTLKEPSEHDLMTPFGNAEPRKRPAVKKSYQREYSSDENWQRARELAAAQHDMRKRNAKDE